MCLCVLCVDLCVMLYGVVLVVCVARVCVMLRVVLCVCVWLCV